MAVIGFEEDYTLDSIWHEKWKCETQMQSSEHTTAEFHVHYVNATTATPSLSVMGALNGRNPWNGAELSESLSVL